MRRSLLAAMMALTAMAGEVREEKFAGRRAYVLENDKIRVSLLRGGGHIAEVRFRTDDPKRGVNPMRVPHYQTIEPYEYQDAKHNELYGSDSHRWLSSGYMGHLLCFPIFGPPSPEELSKGIGNHGEAPIAEWKPVSGGGSGVFRYGADLPKTQYRVDRAVTLLPGESVVRIEETIENLLPEERKFSWVQHATFGPPFVAPGKTALDLNAFRGRVSKGPAETNSLEPDAEFEWPFAKDSAGKLVSLRVMQEKQGAGTYYAVGMSQRRKVSFFTMYSPDFPVLIGYLFRSEESPWVGDFQENGRLKQKPWDGKTVTRGIEFGTTPFAEGLQKSLEREKMNGIPTYRTIAPKEKLTTKYALFLMEIPPDFRGTGDVEIEADELILRERGTGKRLRLPAKGLKQSFE